MPTSVRGRKSKSRFFCDGVAEQFYIAIAMSESGEFSCKPMKERQLMGEFQRGGGESGPPRLKNHQNRVSKNTSLVPLKITKLPSQHSMLGSDLI